ncbi:MAG: hypothetical protein HY815_26955, partial [Candidatus Riflebacteria bacterium]|nr:hypothetical protein [Candidatus Riflebacteria bacterium]
NRSTDQERIIAAFKRVVKEQPASREAPAALSRLADHLDGQQQHLDALELYRGIERDYASFDQIDNVRSRIRNIVEERVDLSGPVHLPVGKKGQFSLNCRNLAKVTLEVHTTDLPRSAREGVRLETDQRSLPRGELVQTWVHETKDTGEHKQYSGQFEFPVQKEGAYLVVARGEKAQEQRLVIVSGLAAIVKTFPTGVLVFVADPATGAPAEGATVILGAKEENARFLRIEEKTLGPDGLARFESPVGADTQWSYQVLATRSGSLTLHTGNVGYNSPRTNPFQVYAYADRPVYRPAQTVHFRAILRSHDGRQYQPLAARAVKITVVAPRTGKTVFDRELQLDRFGCVADDLVLDKDAPLGQYQAHFWTVPAGTEHHQPELFRVEEYRKPEFEVQVRGGLPYYQLGQKVPISIQAKYYFGSPVSGGKVAWRVYRKDSSRSWRPVHEFGWFCKEESPDRGYERHRRYRGGSAWTLAKEGTDPLDASGRLAIEIETEKSWPDTDLKIDAEVTDASRVVNSGSSVVVVTRCAVQVHLAPARRVYFPGEKARIDVYTESASGDPVTFSGTLRVLRAIRERSESQLKTPVEDPLASSSFSRARILSGRSSAEPARSLSVPTSRRICRTVTPAAR